MSGGANGWTMLDLSLGLNVAVLIPVCIGLLWNATWTQAAFGAPTPGPSPRLAAASDHRRPAGLRPAAVADLSDGSYDPARQDARVRLGLALPAPGVGGYDRARVVGHCPPTFSFDSVECGIFLDDGSYAKRNSPMNSTRHRR